MASVAYKIMVAVGAVVSLFHLLCAMGLFSTIIIWLSLEFTAGLPSALALIVGIPCLVSTISFVLMIGIKEKGVILSIPYIVVGVFIIVTGISLMTPFIELYSHENPDLIGDFCSDCDHVGAHTLQCVTLCNDECCFTNFSAPLSRALISFSAVAIGASLASVIIGILNLIYNFKYQQNQQQNRQKSH